MSPGAFLSLAVPRTPADRRRWLLVALACAATATVVLAGLRILRYAEPDEPPQWVYASFILEPGLRGGTLFGVLLCCVPPLVLLIQALRVGSAARERRLAAVRVSGASQRQLRALATVEGAAAGTGGALAGVVGYVLLGWMTPSLPSVYLRIVPTPDRPDLLVVPATVLVIASLAGLSARLSAREVVVAPRRNSLRSPHPLPRSRARLSLAMLTVLGVAVPVVTVLGLHVVAVFAMMILFVILAFVGGPYLVLAAAWRLDRGRDPMRQLAAARLRAEPRPAGRIVAVVAVCGATFYVGSLLVVGLLWTSDPYDREFQAAGLTLALGGALMALAVSVLSLVVAAAEQLLDGRRATAVLTAFGVSTSDLRRALRRQLMAPAGLAAAVGAGLAAVAVGWAYPVALPFTVVGVALAALPALVAGRVAAAFLGPQLADATSAENLRTA